MPADESISSSAVAAAQAPPPRGSARPGTARPLDTRALLRHGIRVFSGPAPWLHEEVARRMAERLAVLRQPPQQVLDWAAHPDGAASALKAACPRARITAVGAFDAGASGASALGELGGAAVDEPSQRAKAAATEDSAVKVPAQPWWSPRRWWKSAANEPLPRESSLPKGTFDLLWANMALHHLAEPEAAFARWRALVAVDGILMFSTLGPGSLASLRALYARRGWPNPYAPFVDMHDLGDMLVNAGFAEPVMDQEILTLTWETPGAALNELRSLGGNAAVARFAGMRTPRWRARLEEALQALARDGRVALEFEVVYGHAVRPAARAKVAAHTEVALDDMRSMLRSRRSP